MIETQLNHGMTLSADGRTLYASDPTAAYSWAYNPMTGTVAHKTALVTGMNTDDHTTRTLLVSGKAIKTLLVSRGSTSNIDPLASDVSTGHSQIKAFDLGRVPTNGYQFDTDGLRLGYASLRADLSYLASVLSREACLASKRTFLFLPRLCLEHSIFVCSKERLTPQFCRSWGLRNSVGVAEHPETGGLYSVENSADEVVRDGVNVHENNPGEEMNYHGTLVGNTDRSQGSNHGYPECFAAWDPTALPNQGDLAVGRQFSLNSTSDDVCAGRTAPRLTFQAHMAPLDIKFNGSGEQAWVTFHGSWYVFTHLPRFSGPLYPLM